MLSDLSIRRAEAITRARSVNCGSRCSRLRPLCPTGPAVISLAILTMVCLERGLVSRSALLRASFTPQGCAVSRRHADRMEQQSLPHALLRTISRTPIR